MEKPQIDIHSFRFYQKLPEGAIPLTKESELQVPVKNFKVNRAYKMLFSENLKLNVGMEYLLWSEARDVYDLYTIHEHCVKEDLLEKLKPFIKAKRIFKLKT